MNDDYELSPLDVKLLQGIYDEGAAPSDDKLRAANLELQAQLCGLNKYVDLQEQLLDNMARALHAAESEAFVWRCSTAGVVLGMLIVVASILWGK